MALARPTPAGEIRASRMSTTAFLAVLLSALLHASWNAWVKRRDDPHAALASCVIGAAAPALLVLLVVGLPPPVVLPWLAGAAAMTVIGMTMTARAYAAGDFAVIYPLLRGTVPLILALAAPLLFAEALPVLRLLGVIAVSAGIAALAWASVWRGARLGLAAISFALAAALAAACYVLVDARAARLGQAPIAYAATATVVNAAAMAAFERLRGRRVRAMLRRNAAVAFGGGTISSSSYLLFVWALAHAPVALAAALRESSILFAVLIAIVLLKERIEAARLGAIGLVLLGVVLIRL